jgi:transposase
MPQGMRWVGLDVHASEATLAIFDDATGEVVTRRVAGRPHELMPWLRAVKPPMRAVYEAGPTGYGLVRRARAEGIDIAVCAPGRSDRSTSRVKTDRRDAIRLARLLAAGELTPVIVPSLEHERLRDLVRCREDIRADLMRARHRLSKFLLRRERYYTGPNNPWSKAHRAWVAGLSFPDDASQLTLADYLHAHDVLVARRDTIERRLAVLAADSPWAETIARLRCLRGIDTLSALGLCAEIGAFERFDDPDGLAAYLGLVPCEHSSGERRRQGSITKAGSSHARRLLVEAAYHYRRRPNVGKTLEHRQRAQHPAIVDLAWRTQRRLHARWRHLRNSRGKPNGVVAIAVARELAAACWQLATHRY